LKSKQTENEQTEEVKEEERGRKGEGTGRMGNLFHVYGGCTITFGICKKEKKVFTDTTSICTDRTHCINTLYKPTTHSIKVTLPVVQETN